MKTEYNFTIKGMVNNQIQRITYKFIDGKGSYIGDDIVSFLLADSLKSVELTGPVGQYMERDINNPLAVLFVLKNDVFDEILEIIGETPVAESLPDDAI